MQQISTEIMVIGAGISGLSTAYFLARHGKQLIILEKANRVGGVIESGRINGFLAEFGPNSILETHPAIGDLLDGLGLKPKIEYANENSKNRYIIKNGRLCPLPLGPMAFLRSPLFSTRAKWRLCLEPFISRANPSLDENLAQFVVRRLGSEFLDYAIDPFVAGVYAGMPEQLSVKSAFPKLYGLEQEYGSLIQGAILGAWKRKRSNEVAKSTARMFSFPDGLATVVDRLGQALADNIHTEAKIQAVRKTPGGYEVDFLKGNDLWRAQSKVVLFTIPSHAYPEISMEFDFPIRETLNAFYYPPITIIYFGYKNHPNKVPIDGFGFLVPQKEKRSILGSLWNSAIFSGRTPAGGVALTTFVGGSRQPENALLSDEKLAAMVQDELRALMGIERAPDVSIIHRVPKSIPQYTVGHEKAAQALSAFEANHPGLYLRGNFIGGIAIGDVIKESQRAAQQIDQYLKANRPQRCRLT